MSRAPTLDESRPLWRAFLVFLLPLMAQNILQSLSATISSIIVGRTLGTRELAAAATFMPVVFFFIAFLIGITAGASVLIGQAYGAGKLSVVRRIAGTALTVSTLGGLVIAVLGVALTPRILHLLGTPPDILANATAYARASFITMPALFLFILGGALLRGMGDTVRPLLIQIVATAVSAALTYLLVTRTSLGIRGAAFGQGAAQLAAFVALALWLRALDHPLAPSARMLRRLRPDPKLLMTILRVGLPTGVQIVVGSLSGLVIVGLVNAFGSDATAAYGAVGQVQAYVQFPALSIAIAASIFGAQMIGAGQAQRLDSVVRTAMLMNLVLTGGLVVLVTLFSRSVVSLFITEPEVVDLAQRLLHIVTWSALMFGAGTIFSGVMRASGTVLVPMLIGVGCVLLIELPTAITLSGVMGLHGIWWGYVAGFAGLMILQGAYYMLVWRRKTVAALV
ncbi:MATE family efflux transporter [Paracoccus suum]|uniref:MATE family efflux transporter n=1 Tax=Paracoccus suum TaxID=2259340 RepID=A0A344PLU5_9RHOB|nr:MATE family efflux transporter [Paracoccus suum]AXC50350.1 MATE family efflux transporter [Paracoccus suum]